MRAGNFFVITTLQCGAKPTPCGEAPPQVLAAELVHGEYKGALVSAPRRTRDVATLFFARFASTLSTLYVYMNPDTPGSVASQHLCRVCRGGTVLPQ